jgi:hypothetical protein
MSEGASEDGLDEGGRPTEEETVSLQLTDALFLSAYRSPFSVSITMTYCGGNAATRKKSIPSGKNGA